MLCCQHVYGMCYTLAHNAAGILHVRSVLIELQLLLLGNTAFATTHQPKDLVHCRLMVCTCIPACEQR